MHGKWQLDVSLTRICGEVRKQLCPDRLTDCYCGQEDPAPKLQEYRSRLSVQQLRERGQHEWNEKIRLVREVLPGCKKCVRTHVWSNEVACRSRKRRERLDTHACTSRDRESEVASDALLSRVKGQARANPGALTRKDSKRSRKQRITSNQANKAHKGQRNAR